MFQYRQKGRKEIGMNTIKNPIKDWERIAEPVWKVSGGVTLTLTQHLEVLDNFILWYTSNEAERDRMHEAARDYLEADHAREEGDVK
jgi:hypothetical protein